VWIHGFIISTVVSLGIRQWRRHTYRLIQECARCRVDLQLDGHETAVEFHGPLHYAIDLGTEQHLAEPRELGKSIMRQRYARACA
jgi:hypothetical protein